MRVYIESNDKETALKLQEPSDKLKKLPKSKKNEAKKQKIKMKLLSLTESKQENIFKSFGDHFLIFISNIKIILEFIFNHIVSFIK